MNVLKPDLAASMMARLPWASERQCLRSINFILDGLTDAISGGGKAYIEGFGTFTLSFRPPRVMHDPRKIFGSVGYFVNVPAKYAPVFRSHSAMAGEIET